MEAFWDVAGHRRRPVLVDMRRVRSIDRAARVHYVSPESALRTLAVGILVGSPLSRVVGNFFIGLNKAPIPTRLFSAEPEALRWLQGFIVEAERPAPTGDQISLQ